MSGENDLHKLLASMKPVLDPETYVFCTTDTPIDVPYLMQFREAEGWTYILTENHATEARLTAEFLCRRITLNIHSSLDTIGFLAKILPALASNGMGVNPVSGFYHDHLFVPASRAEDAMMTLTNLSQKFTKA